MPNPSLTGGVFVLEGGAAQPTGGAKTKCSTSDTEFDAGYFREGEDCLFKAAFGRALFFPFCEVFVERDRRRAFVAGAKLKLTAKTFLTAERRIPGLGNGVLQGILFQACIYLKRMFAALDEGVAERLFGTSLSFVRKIPPCAPPAVQAAMRAVEFVKSFAVLVHVQVARVALRAARGVEPLLVILENHEVEQAQ